MECVKFLNMKLNNRDASVNNSSAASIKVFENPEFGKVRTVVISGNPWFVGNDVASVLGYKYSKDAIRDNVDDDDKMVIQLSDIQDGEQNSLPSHMKGSKITIINYSGLYSLVLRSNLEAAKRFKKWITSEVIPSIYNTGFYSIKNNTVDSKPSSMEDVVRSLGATAEIMQKLFRSSNASAAAYFNKGITQLGLPPIDYVPSKGVKFSATDLLRKFDRSESIYKFNKRMLELGYLEEKTRVSRKSPNGFKKFKAITEKGLEFGENMINPNNELETQPHYYESKFGELLSILFE